METKKALALLSLLALGDRDIAAGRTKPARVVIERLRWKASAPRAP
jgi:hypothetical protein